LFVQCDALLYQFEMTEGKAER